MKDGLIVTVNHITRTYSYVITRGIEDQMLGHQGNAYESYVMPVMNRAKSIVLKLDRSADILRI